MEYLLLILGYPVAVLLGALLHKYILNLVAKYKAKIKADILEEFGKQATANIAVADPQIQTVPPSSPTQQISHSA